MLLPHHRPGRPRGARAAAVLLAAAAVLTACGDDEPDRGDDAPSASSDGADAATAACATSLTATYPGGEEVVLDASAAAVRLADGAGYTMYAADHELPTEDITTATVVPPEGGHQATVFITTFDAAETPEPVASGDVVEATDEFGVRTFGAMLLAGAETHGSAMDVEGTLTVTAVDDEGICVEVDYRDGEKSLVGTLSAPVFDAGF